MPNNRPPHCLTRARTSLSLIAAIVFIATIGCTPRSSQVEPQKAKSKRVAAAPPSASGDTDSATEPGLIDPDKSQPVSQATPEQPPVPESVKPADGTGSLPDLSPLDEAADPVASDVDILPAAHRDEEPTDGDHSKGKGPVSEYDKRRSKKDYVKLNGAIFENWEKPKLAIFPITGVESTGYELIELSRRHDFRTLFLVNGWDNLSSKTVFGALPDYMGLWGQQSLEDAVTIHGLTVDRGFLLGCARYEPYFGDRDQAEAPFPFRYAVFAGSTTACDEREIMMGQLRCNS